MSDGARPGMTAKARADHEARLAREAAALRENLLRRKAHLRARQAGSAAPAAEGDTPEPKRPDKHGLS